MEANMHIANDLVIIGGGVLAQAAAGGDFASIGTAVSNLGPTALLGIGVVWAIRRGDKLVDELHEVRAQHDAATREMTSALAQATEVMAHNNRVIEHCKDTQRKGA